MERLQPNVVIWVQKDGTPIWIRDMSSSHLQNTVRMLRRNALTYATACSDPPWFDDESASFNINPEELLEDKPYFHTMLLELRMRGVKELPVEEPVANKADDRTSAVDVLVLKPKKRVKRRRVESTKDRRRKKRKVPVRSVRRKRAKLARRVS
jgi:hypothetical protein